MARPRKNPDEPKWQVAQESSMTEHVSAPVQYMPPPPPAPRVMRVEREGAQSEPYSRRFPKIQGGVCEFCGVLDPNVPSQFQYKLCEHYRGMQARCTYCPESKDPDDVVYHEYLNVAEHPEKPGVLIMWCGSFNCSQAHMKRFKRAAV